MQVAILSTLLTMSRIYTEQVSSEDAIKAYNPIVT